MHHALFTSLRRSLFNSSCGQLLLWPLALAAAGCSDDGGNLDATADIYLEVPSEIAADLEYPLLVTLSIGHQGHEEANSSEAAQTYLVFCRELAPFVYDDSVRLRATCQQEDYYVRATLRTVTLEDEDACESANGDGILLVDRSEVEPGNRVIAEASSAAWEKGDCGPQHESFDLVVE